MALRAAQRHPFEDVPRTPEQHFNLCFYGAVLQVIRSVSSALDSWEAAFERFPFLAGYNNELAARGLEGMAAGEGERWWWNSVGNWERGTTDHLPLVALREAGGVDQAAMTALLIIGLVEEDSRFGAVFEGMQETPGQNRPSVGLLDAWFGAPTERAGFRAGLRRLRDLGLVQVLNPDAPRAAWSLHIPSLVWDAIRGETDEEPAPWLHCQPSGALPLLDHVIIPNEVGRRLAGVPRMLNKGDVRALIVRGPKSNGRHTLVGAVSRAIGAGMLSVRGVVRPDDERWPVVCALALLLNAVPCLEFDLGPGETAELPPLKGYDGPLAIVLGRQGGLSGALGENTVTVLLELPDSDARLRHWSAGLGPVEVEDLESVAVGARLTSGNIRRLTSLARSCASLEGRTKVTAADVRQASSTLHRQILDSLAAKVEVRGNWSNLVAGADTLRELRHLESRCRRREALGGWVGACLATRLNNGVRALFQGPSGTGKTMAAGLLAAVLQKDLYRVDLSSVVNEYLGRTEKNLNQLFSRAEELDVVILLDEGDALLTARTSVRTSNDRYANLETNFLLQRLESYEGIVIVTTNAGDRIDSAFQRRMDVIVDFRAPEATERLAIWQMHLPAEHAVEPGSLLEVAGRCALTGGQIRNAVLHASLLALESGQVITLNHLEEAVEREYRKAGAVCPLRRPAVRPGSRP